MKIPCGTGVLYQTAYCSFPFLLYIGDDKRYAMFSHMNSGPSPFLVKIGPTAGIVYAGSPCAFALDTAARVWSMSVADFKKKMLGPRKEDMCVLGSDPDEWAVLTFRTMKNARTTMFAIGKNNAAFVILEQCQLH